MCNGYVQSAFLLIIKKSSYLEGFFSALGKKFPYFDDFLSCKSSRLVVATGREPFSGAFRLVEQRHFRACGEDEDGILAILLAKLDGFLKLILGEDAGAVEIETAVVAVVPSAHISVML